MDFMLSGCAITLTVVVTSPTTPDSNTRTSVMHTAHVGDVEAWLCRTNDKKGENLTLLTNPPHRPDEISEYILLNTRRDVEFLPPVPFVFDTSQEGLPWQDPVAIPTTFNVLDSVTDDECKVSLPNSLRRDRYPPMFAWDGKTATVKETNLKLMHESAASEGLDGGRRGRPRMTGPHRYEAYQNFPARVAGLSHLTRSLGDYLVKYHWSCTSIPDVTTRTVEPGDVIVISSSSLWRSWDMETFKKHIHALKTERPGRPVSAADIVELTMQQGATCPQLQKLLSQESRLLGNMQETATLCSFFCLCLLFIFVVCFCIVWSLSDFVFVSSTSWLVLSFVFFSSFVLLLSCIMLIAFIVTFNKIKSRPKSLCHRCSMT